MKSKAEPVLVVWLDHTKTDGDPRFLKPSVRETVGWLVKDREDYLVVAHDRTKGKGGGFEYGFAILKSDVVEVRALVAVSFG